MKKPPFFAVVFRFIAYQLKAMDINQSVTPIEMKKRPSPTGEPQENHEPHERQCFRDSPWYFRPSSCSRCFSSGVFRAIFCSTFLKFL